MDKILCRRNFLGAAAVATTGICIGSRTSRAGEFTGKIKKAVKYHMITEDLSIRDKFQLLKELGFDGVELRTRDKFDRGEALRASESTGLPIHGVINSSDPDIKSAIELAKYFGGTSVLVVVPTDAKGSYLANYKERQDIIRRAIPDAEKHEIKILIENVWASFLIEPLSMARFVDELDSPMVGVYFDVGNNIRWGYAEHWIEVLGKRIGKLDIKEFDRTLQNNEGLRNGFNVEIGEGSVDWPRVREELQKIEYSGWATAEVKGGGRERLAEIAARMNNVLDL
ncbi:MAG: sugar phosphate isomerase/epimerase [Planctomycetaceae bacterium]|nr:sugar phosphate isomerase/epimerase [Planctomycetales bacterium]MCB9923918.1 sugar phosphate isomerase/epimerase [Planctomycetaceae bacterium]